MRARLVRSLPKRPRQVRPRVRARGRQAGRSPPRRGPRSRRGLDRLHRPRRRRGRLRAPQRGGPGGREGRPGDRQHLRGETARQPLLQRSLGPVLPRLLRGGPPAAPRGEQPRLGRPHRSGRLHPDQRARHRLRLAREGHAPRQPRLLGRDRRHLGGRRPRGPEDPVEGAAPFRAARLLRRPDGRRDADRDRQPFRPVEHGDGGRGLGAAPPRAERRARSTPTSSRPTRRSTPATRGAPSSTSTGSSSASTRRSSGRPRGSGSRSRSTARRRSTASSSSTARCARSSWGSKCRSSIRRRPATSA